MVCRDVSLREGGHRKEEDGGEGGEGGENHREKRMYGFRGGLVRIEGQAEGVDEGEGCVSDDGRRRRRRRVRCAR